MATLIEFLAPLVDATHQDRCLATLYYMEQYEGSPGLTTAEIYERLVVARAPSARKVNVGREMRNAAPLAHAPNTDERGVQVWGLTDTGREHVREMLGLPSLDEDIEHDAALLTRLATNIKDDVIRSYVDEAILCLRVGALRAPVVFLWAGAIRKLQEDVLDQYKVTTVATALQKHDQRVGQVKKVADFSSINDKTTLLGMREVGLLDKGEWTTLGEALDLRNRCGHPTRYKPGVQRASSYIEDVVGIVFS